MGLQHASTEAHLINDGLHMLLQFCKHRVLHSAAYGCQQLALCVMQGLRHRRQQRQDVAKQDHAAHKRGYAPARCDASMVVLHCTQLRICSEVQFRGQRRQQALP